MHQGLGVKIPHCLFVWESVNKFNKWLTCLHSLPVPPHIQDHSKLRRETISAPEFPFSHLPTQELNREKGNILWNQTRYARYAHISREEMWCWQKAQFDDTISQHIQKASASVVQVGRINTMNKQHRWDKTLATDNLPFYPDCLMLKRRTDTRGHISHSCYLVSIHLPLHWKLSWHRCSLRFHRKQREARLSRCYQGTKVKPFDCSVIALTVYLPGVASPLSIHTYSSLPRNKRPSLESNIGFSESESQRFGLAHGVLPTPPLSKSSWQTCTVGLVAESQSYVPHSERWTKPRVTPSSLVSRCSGRDH